MVEHRRKVPPSEQDRLERLRKDMSARISAMVTVTAATPGT